MSQVEELDIRYTAADDEYYVDVKSSGARSSGARQWKYSLIDWNLVGNIDNAGIDGNGDHSGSF